MLPFLGLDLVYAYMYENSASARRHMVKCRCINIHMIQGEALFCWWLNTHSEGSGMPRWSEIGLFLQETAAGDGPSQTQSSSDN